MNNRPAFSPRVALLASLTAASPSYGASESVDQFLAFDLEQLMEVEVYSAARRSERLLRSDSAVYVISSIDIERLGAPTLPDILRTVPGLHVARFNSHMWAVSVRGFNDVFANKLLVMVDGRSVYTREFGGTYWNMVDIPPGQIARIEVVRGPGGALWGSNAFNGIINIITHKASDQQGSVAELSVGNQDRAQLRLGHSTRLAGGDFSFDFRLRDRDREPTAVDWLEDSWRNYGIGLRYDRSIDDSLSFDISAGFDRGRLDDNRWDAPIAFREEYAIDYVTATLSRESSDGLGWNLNGYVDRYERELPLERDLTSFGLSWDGIWMGLDRHTPQLGAELKYTRAHYVNQYGVDIPEPDDSYRIYSLFMQDTIRLDDEDRLNLIVGGKWERYEQGHEWQPNLRLGWAIDDQSHLWGALSRAVRTPTLADLSFSAIIPAYDEEGRIESEPAYIGLVTNPELEAERLDALEVGYRHSFGSGRGVDITLFRHHYSNLIDRNGSEAFVGADVVPEGLVYYMTQVGGFEADSHGAELALDWTVAKSDWRAGISYLDLTLRAADRDGEDISDVEPRLSAFVTGHWQATKEWGLGATVRAMDEWCGLFRMRQVTYGERGCLPGYVALDLNASWQPLDGLELALHLRDLGAGDHYEIDTRGANMTLSEQPQSWMLTARWRID